MVVFSMFIVLTFKLELPVNYISPLQCCRICFAMYLPSPVISTNLYVFTILISILLSQIEKCPYHFL